MTLKQEILQLITRSPGLTDRQITNSLRGTAAPQQPVNTACRELYARGLLVRICNRSSDNLIGNYPVNADSSHFGSERDSKFKVAADGGSDHLSEDEIKKALEVWLSRQDWNVKIAWGKQHGIDIEAFRAKEHWIIEVKGPGSRQPMRVNYFLAILGELLQRMSDKDSAYSIALPDMPQYHGLWKRLPSLAKRRTKISILFVDFNGTVTHLDQ